MADEPKALALREGFVAEPEALRAQLANSRARLEQAVEGLRDDLQGWSSWRGWVGKHPWLAVTAAVAVGVGVGVLVNRLTARSSDGPSNK